MGINSTSTAYGFGQLGSAYTTSSSDAIKPPTNKVFVAITMLADTVFDASGGLIAEIPISNDIYIGTEQPAHDLDSGSETTIEGSGGQRIIGTAVSGVVEFPEGATIYGRWTSIQTFSGGCIAYVGE